MDRTRKNRFVTFSPSQRAHTISRRLTGVPIPMELIRRYQRAVSGKKITNK